MLETLDKPVDGLTGWQAEWMQRSLPALCVYTFATYYTLYAIFILLSLASLFSAIHAVVRSKANPNDRASISARLDKRIINLYRGQWFTATTFMLNVLLISLVDAYIACTALGRAVNQDPTWNANDIIDLAVFILLAAAVATTTLIIVPLLQTLLATHLLIRFARKQDVATLEAYVPLARGWSTHVAQLWASMCFIAIAWWAPSSAGSSLWRTVFVQASVGSAMLWLNVSFAFNFCGERLGEEDIEEVCSGKVAEALRLFTKTIKVVHVGEKSGEAWPRYEQGRTTESDLLLV